LISKFIKSRLTYHSIAWQPLVHSVVLVMRKEKSLKLILNTR